MSPAPTIELISLPGKGRGETIRLLLTFASRQFIDTRLTIAQWKGKKVLEGFSESTKLPVMKINGTRVIIGVIDICRHIALQYGLYGSSSGDQEKIDEVIRDLEGLNVAMNPILRATLTKNYDARKESWNTFKQDSLIPMLNKYEEILGQRKFLVDDKYTWADIALIEFITRCQQCYDSFFLAHFEHLRQFCQVFEMLPTIRPYIQSRTDTFF
ncbi:unnamed protein product [Caenorhabditis angaria]|uniref:Uncharacterized protein n=1 Tax=Caenorhabditis angaria TaxID=860376 RepID=A0A9P1MTE2_9PELO|nr:unnamed protein product [Caenorhabditis angaria]